jgi:hypothetical protein
MAHLTVKLGVFLLVVLAVVIGVVPILVIIDLLGGGSGLGLCPDGLEVCHKPYTTGAELVIGLTFGMFVILWSIRILMRLARRLEDDAYQVSERR